jgi:hypothetical protein
MSIRCPECGAPIVPGESCRRYLESLLALEWEIPGGPGELPHFFAVAAYGLQHPCAMNYTLATLVGLREAVADALIGRASIAELRRRARAGARQDGRVTRRAGNVEVGWRITAWPMMILDVLPAMASRASYVPRVTQWARSVVDTLEDHHPVP